MIEKPDFNDENIVTCLQDEYGLRIIQFTFLPLGGDLSSALYRAVADDETPYFCKIRFGVFDETCVALPKFLHDRGIAQIIPPLSNRTGRLWATLDEAHLILYPFVEGGNGYDVQLSESQWADFGAALQRIHTMTAPQALLPRIAKETYSSEWRDACRNILERFDRETFNDPIMVKAAALLHPHRDTILDYVGRAERFAQVLVSRSTDFVLCHCDIHPGNLFIDTAGAVFIVDWDYPMLAPKERDLMFIGGGQYFNGYTNEEEETLFYRGYGSSTIDPIALAYYRYERSITDICVECKRILSTTLGDKERAQSLEILGWGFLPNSTIEVANSSDRTRSEMQSTG